MSEALIPKVNGKISTRTAIAYLERAEVALTEAASVDRVNEIFEFAEIVRRIQKDHLIQLKAGVLKARAARRGGLLLRKMAEKNQRRIRGQSHQVASATRQVTLEELSVNKSKSSRWQDIEAIPDKSFDQAIETIEERWSKADNRDGVMGFIQRLAAEVKRDKEREALIEAIDGKEMCRLIQGSVSEALNFIEPQSIDAIITDPPYGREYFDVYRDLANVAPHLLKPGGSLFVMIGHSYLPDLVGILAASLPYHWTLAYLTPGGQSVHLWQRNVNTFWKPILWLVNGTYEGPWMGDVIRSAPNDNDKRFHEWGQSESGLLDLVDRCTMPGQLILDPFVGGGSTGYAALKLGRRFIGMDIDPEAISLSLGRLQGISNGSPATGQTGADTLA